MTVGEDSEVRAATEIVVIGISGPSGSGKTAVSQGLQKLLPGSTILRQDLYFKPGDMLDTFDNFCDLDCLFLDDFVRDSISLARGREVRVPNLDLNTFERLSGFTVYSPSGFVLVEGMTIFRIPEIYSLFNHRFYLSPGMDEIRRRKTKRDLHDRGKTKEEIDYQLSWIDHEYTHDLENLPPEIEFISGPASVEQVCQHIIEKIRGEG